MALKPRAVSVFPPLAVLFVGLALLCPLAKAQQQDSEEIPGLKYIPGKPWTQIVPDPDVYQWKPVQSRPGYRYRGMLPMHQRFYDYIQAKRKAGQALSWADWSMIKWLQSLRRWPEAPAPNDLSKAFMKYLRSLDRDELNFAESLMYSQIVARGYLPYDPQPNETQRRLIEYLSSGPFQPRNWFERIFGRVEPWLEQYVVSHGYTMAAAAPGGPIFPSGPFNGMQISYNVSGAVLGLPRDSYSSHTKRVFSGVLPEGQLTVSGVALWAGDKGWDADLSVIVWAGAKSEEFKGSVKGTGAGFNGQPFSLTVPVPKGTDGGGFLIRMDGYYSMGGGSRRLSVEGYLERDAAEKRAELDAAWRKKVEETLAKLGYEDTPEGQALKEMRAALEGGDAAWKAYVDRQLAALGYEDTPDGQECKKLAEAMEAGGDTWNGYVAEHLGTGAAGGEQQQTGGQEQAGGEQQAGGQEQPGGQQGATGGSGTGSGGQTGAPPPPPDVGGLQVGTASNGGQLQGVADRFPSTSRLVTVYEFEDLPEGTIIVCVWTRDGEEIARQQRPAVGTGWVSFGIRTGDGSSWPKGRYTVTLSAGEKVLGRKTFYVGN